MAEYYPLLAKAVGSLPNSTPDTRRVVYERARKALIGQLKTLHPPVPDEDIERESVELDRAIERLETELAAAPPVAPPTPPISAEPAPPVESAPTPPPASAPPGPTSPRTAGPGGALGALATRKPISPLRPRVPRPAARPAPPGAAPSDAAEASSAATETVLATPAAPPEASEVPPETDAAPTVHADAESDATKPRLESQRPFAPQPPLPKGPKRRVWIVPAGLGVVVLLVALAAWKLRVKPETAARNVPTITQEQQEENGKIADRVGEPKVSPGEGQGGQPSSSAPATPSTTNAETSASNQKAQAPVPPAGNAEQPAAHRAALLVEAPDLPSKVQTFPGTVVWKLNNVNAGPGDAVGLQVEADVDLPDDKTKAVVTFEKNNDPSLPASHTIKVRFMVEPGSYSGDVKQINVPQMRREGNSDGEPLAGVTVPVIQNSFLVGLSPGNAETANLRLIGDLPWIDVPILLTSGKIAKLTFEKGAAGTKDINEALAYWQKP